MFLRWRSVLSEFSLPILIFKIPTLTLLKCEIFPGHKKRDIMEEAVEILEKQMQKTDEKLDNLAVQVGNIENGIFSEDGTQIEVFTLLKSVNEVKNNYQNLHREIQEVQGLQKELSTKLQGQLMLMQKKCHMLKEKLCVRVPEKQTASDAARLILTPKSPTSSGREKVE